MILSLLILILFLIHHYYLKPVTKYSRPVTYALLLGCPCHDDGSLSTSQIQRCNLAIEAYQKGFFKTLILSGSAVKNQYYESKEMANYIAQKIDMPILLETKARNTFENFKYTKEITNDVDLLILTSSLHARRSQAIARQFYTTSYVYTYPDHKLKHVGREIVSRIIYIKIEIQKRMRSKL